MEAPQNLVDAVSRIKPRVILVLDTNVIMKFPWLDRLKISTSGPFLLVVPILVDGELVRLRKDKDEQTRKKASRAHWVTSKLYKQGNPPTGIELGNDRWLITVSAPASAGFNVLEDEQARSDKGKVDAALLRMTAAYTKDFPDVLTLFVTEEHDLRRRASISGLSACQRSDLSSPETFKNVFRETRLNEELNIEDAIVALLDPKNKQTLKIAITLEELKSEGDDLVARGTGLLAYDGKRYPYRWTFPYKNLAIYNRLTDDTPESAWYAVMPLENVDFMGADDEIPEDVRRYVCNILEDAYESNELQSPITRVRNSILWHTSMGFTRGVLYGGHSTEVQKEGLTPQEAEEYDELRIQNDRHMHSLFDGSAQSVGREYRSVFQLSEAVDVLLDDEIEDYHGDWWDLETALIEFLDDALGTWTVGETREAEYAYRPFAWPEDEAVDDDEDGKEEETE